MLRCIIIFLLLNISGLNAQKELLRPFSKKAVLSPVPIERALQIHKYFAKDSVFVTKDSLNDYIHLSPVRNQAISYSTCNNVGGLDSIWLDTTEVKGYEGEFFLKQLYHYTFLNPGNDLVDVKEWTVPNSTTYYQNVDLIKQDTIFGKLVSESMSNKPMDDFFAPFFMKNYEVSNLEYHWFVEYVKDSIARRLLGEHLGYDDWAFYPEEENGQLPDEDDWLLNWETPLNWEKSLENEEEWNALSQMYLTEERFYSRLMLDVRKFNYKYTNDAGITKTLNIYPDTTVFKRGFSPSILSFTGESYFWHPAYDDFPVVGVSYEQAKAFCHWKTIYLRKYFRIKGIKFKPTVQLPSAIQWEYASRKQLEKLGSYLNTPFDWETSLILSEDYKHPQPTNKTYKNKDGYVVDVLTNDTLERPKRIESVLSNTSLNIVQEPYFVRPFSYFTEKLTENKIRKNDVLNIQNLGSNVSEWLAETYQDNWKSQFYKRMELLMRTPGMDATIQALKEEYFNAYNHENGALVMGANWYDFRDEFRKGNTTESQSVKTFPEKTKSFATVGFRYVIVLEEL